jgi:hypothetical protein
MEVKLMENMIFCGHAWERHLTLIENDSYKEVVGPGGAALARVLVGCQSGQTHSDCKREYIRLERVGEALFPAGRSGWTGGNCVAPMSGHGPAVVWDEGFGGINLPENGPVLWASNRALPSEQTAEALRGRGFLLLDADVLRRCGAMISRQVSWEHTATDLVWQLNNNPAINYLSRLDHILIVFSEDGAVHLYNEDGVKKARLVLAGGGAEGTLRGKYRATPDAWAAIVAACALQFDEVMAGTRKLSVTPLLTEAEHALKSGFNLAAMAEGKYPAVSIGSETVEEGFSVPVRDGCEGADPNYWRIGGESTGRRIFDIAFDYVKNGAAAIKGLPQFSFGDLTTVDRREIEAYSNVRNLITGYAAAPASKPLSIVVFGAPGNGKSFGISEIAQNILPELVKKMEFNVSQFTGSGDLAAAFHQVRDVIIGGKLPLVFFDEFDSDRDGRPLGWLKSFLMPMQDGKFKDGAGDHPTGKCILVFAGGTSPTFEDFVSPLKSGDAKTVREFKDVKGPDFISRLRGTVNVLGPNRLSADDDNYILRRALLLRGLLQRKPALRGTPAPVNDNVLRAMLLAPNYKYGARSMEAILDMSRIEGASWDPASLPFYTQLSFHVDADAFIRLVLGEVRLNCFADKLARAIHEDFIAKSGGPGAENFAQPWEDLGEEIRESNRRQARSITKKLGAIGYGCDAGDTPFTSVGQFGDEEILELARIEHDLWSAEKMAAGWVSGSTRDNAKKIHPDLVPWEELGPEERQKDINTAKNIIPLLNLAGLRVYKMV